MCGRRALIGRRGAGGGVRPQRPLFTRGSLNIHTITGRDGPPQRRMPVSRNTRLHAFFQPELQPKQAGRRGHVWRGAAVRPNDIQHGSALQWAPSRPVGRPLERNVLFILKRARSFVGGPPGPGTGAPFDMPVWPLTSPGVRPRVRRL